MKRLILLVCVAGLLAALPISHLAVACNPPARKVLVCHVNSANDTVRDGRNPGTWYFGRAIEVAASAVEAHLAHGDAVFGGDYPRDLTKAKRAAIEAVYGVSLPNANCYFFVYD